MNNETHFNSCDMYVGWYSCIYPQGVNPYTGVYVITCVIVNNTSVWIQPGLNHMIAYRLEEKLRFWRRILIIDDEADVTITSKTGIEDSNNYNDSDKRIEVDTSNNPLAALSEFKPNFYDLLLVDINMPNMNGFDLAERIVAIDINVKVCFMSCAAEINYEALREIYPISLVHQQKASQYRLFG